MSRNTYIIILVLVALGIGLFFVMDKDSAQVPDTEDVATTTPDDSTSATTTDDELKAWLDEYGMNTPEDIGFPTTAEESDFVPPEGWVRYTFELGPDEWRYEYSQEVLDDFFGYYTDDPSSFRGFEFWYPSEFGRPSIFQTRADFLDNADDVPGSFWVSTIDQFTLKGGNPTTLVAVSPLSHDKNLLRIMEESAQKGHPVVNLTINDRMVVKGFHEGINGSIVYSYFFEVGPYLYNLGFGVEEGPVDDKLFPNVVTSDGMTREEVFQNFFKSFRFVDKKVSKQQFKLFYPDDISD